MSKSAWQLLEDVRSYTLEILESVPEELTDVVPDGFNNSVRWNAGHMLLDQYLWFYHKIADEMPLKELSVHFAYGTSPADWNDENPALSMNDIKQLLREQVPFLKKTFGDRLEEKLLSPSDHGIETIGDVIARTIYHEGLHTGALILLKRSLETHYQIVS